MATSSKTDIKDRIANNKLLKQILIDMVDSYIDSLDGPLDFENEAVLQIDGTTELGVKGDGRLYGRSLHNQGDVTGTTDQYIASGTYTPSTFGPGANVTNIVLYECTWLRVGNVVTVSGRLEFDVTTISIDTRVFLTLPIASNFASFENGGGTCSSVSKSSSFGIQAETVNNVMFIQGIPVDIGASDRYFTFTYEIL